MLHGIYNIRNWLEMDELKEWWKFIQTFEELTFKKPEESVLSRWQLVGACACTFKESFNVWKNVCEALVEAYKTNSAINQIVACTLNLLQNNNVISDMNMITYFHSTFLFPHFKFFQISDPKAGDTPSFLAQQVTPRYFLMLEDLSSFENSGWK